VSVAYQRTQRSSLHPNVMELGRGGTKPGPYWSMRWLPAGPSHVRTTVKDDWAGVFRSPARLLIQSRRWNTSTATWSLTSAGGGIETATPWTADRIRRAMGRPCADNGQCAPRFPRIGVGALVAAIVKAELESLNVALSAATRFPFTGTSPWAHVSMGRLRSPTNEDCPGRAKREPLGPVRGAGATRRPAREP